jgi:hypothetical protein
LDRRNERFKSKHSLSRHEWADGIEQGFAVILEYLAVFKVNYSMAELAGGRMRAGKNAHLVC